ncbi:MAG TPA: hypothetical protein PK733_13400 [Clostridiales bacterium]|nr:hypothetical protein [Clostridiales bacterium]
MTIEIVRSIKNAEQEADNLIKESISKAHNIMSDAEKQKNEVLAKIVEEAEQESANLLMNMEKEVQGEIEGIYRKAEEEGKLIKNKARTNINKAVDIVVERIVNSHVNS